MESSYITESYGQGEALRVRSDVHIARRLYHVLGVAVILSIFHNVDRATALGLLSLAILIVVPVDLIRIRIPSVNQWVVNTFRPLLRQSEVNGLSGMTYLLSGALISVFFFPKQIATLSLFLLAVGDPVSSFFGVLYGKDKIVGNKSLQGTMAGFIACTVVAMAFYSSRHIMTDRLLLVSLLTGIAGAVAELVPIGKLDDNLSFPIVSSALLWFIFSLFGGFP